MSLSSRKSIVGAHDLKALIIWHRTNPVTTDQISLRAGSLVGVGCRGQRRQRQRRTGETGEKNEARKSEPARELLIHICQITIQ